MSNNYGNYMLTTVDNPFNPFTHWEEWLKWDTINGYDTCGFLARLAPTTNKFSDERNDEEINYAMDLIVRTLPGIYKKITKKDKVEEKEAQDTLG